jgi:hypothetical protein
VIEPGISGALASSCERQAIGRTYRIALVHAARPVQEFSEAGTALSDFFRQLRRLGHVEGYLALFGTHKKGRRCLRHDGKQNDPIACDGHRSK